MSTITKLEIWDSPGFLEEAVDVPKLGASLSSPSRTITTELRPSVDRLLSEMKVPGDYSTLRNSTYLRVTLDMNNGTDQIFYGWVDSVEISSDSADYPLCTIRWHVDLWRTYSGSASFGSGHVRRKPTGSHPLQGYERIRRIVTDTVDLVDRQTYSTLPLWWTLLACTVDDGSGNKKVEFRAWPVVGSNLYLDSDGTHAGTLCPTDTETFDGRWDELLGLSPNEITGCWLVPFFPTGSVSGGGTSANPYHVGLASGWEFASHGSGAKLRSYFRNTTTLAAIRSQFPAISKTISPMTSTERGQLLVTSWDGEVIQEIPVGGQISAYTYRLVASPTGMAITFRFSAMDSRAEGLTATIPCPTMELSENAWSEYVYSGQREFDREMRQLQTLQNGIQSAAGGALNGAVMGGLGNIGAGAGVGLALGGATVSTALDYYMFNPRIQEKNDRLMQSQSAGILLSGEARDVFVHGRAPALITMTFDAYSESQASARDAQFGFAVDEFNTSLASDLTSAMTGFWQIDSLVVGGSIPAEAKRYISRRFAAGVRLK